MKSFCISLLLLLSAVSFAQPDTLWTRTYGGLGDDYGFGILALDDGDLAIAATSNSFGAGAMEFYVLRITTTGDTVWTRHRNATGENWCVALTQRTTGDLVTAGYGYNSVSNHWTTLEAYYTTDGAESGSHTYADSRRDVYAYSVCPTPHGGYVTAGSVEDSSGRRYAAAFEIDSGATPGFQQILTLGYSSQIQSIKPAAGGGYILGGYVRATPDTTSDFLLVRLNANGDVVWTSSFGGAAEDIANCVAQTRDGGFAITGPTDSYGPNGDVVLIKTDAQGQVQWLRTYGGNDEEHGHVILNTRDGGYFITGHTNSFGEGGDVYAVKTDSAGNRSWSRFWGGPGLDVAESAVETADGGYALVGHTSSFGAGSTDVWVLRIGPDLSSGEQYSAVPGGFSLAQNYPNPFNSSTRISYNVPRSGRVTLTVFDVLGRTTATLFDATQAAGPHDVRFDASSMSTGIYFYRLDASGWSDIKKMMVLK